MGFQLEPTWAFSSNPKQNDLGVRQMRGYRIGVENTQFHFPPKKVVKSLGFDGNFGVYRRRDKVADGPRLTRLRGASSNAGKVQARL